MTSLWSMVLLLFQLRLQAYPLVDSQPTENIVRVRFGRLLRLKCYSDTVSGEAMEWYQFNSITKECSSVAWNNKYLFGNTPYVKTDERSSTLYIPEATYSKVGIYKCVDNQTTVQVFNVRLCQNRDSPHFSNTPKDIVNAKVGEEVNFSCSVNFACATPSNFTLRLEDSNGRIIKEATDLTVNSNSPRKDGETTYFDTVVTAQLSYEVVDKADMTAVCSFNSSESETKTARAKLTKVRSEADKATLVILVTVSSMLLALLFAVVKKWYQDGKICYSLSFQSCFRREKDKKYDVFMFDLCDTRASKELLTHLKSIGYEICTLDDIIAGEPLVDRSGQLSESSQCVIFIYKERLLDFGDDNIDNETVAEIDIKQQEDSESPEGEDGKVNRRSMYMRYINAIRGMVKTKSHRSLTLVCEMSKDNSDEKDRRKSEEYWRERFSDGDSKIRSIRHMVTRDSDNFDEKFLKEIRNRIPRPTIRKSVYPDVSVTSTKPVADQNSIPLNDPLLDQR